jgi:hypothetical protein
MQLAIVAEGRAPADDGTAKMKGDLKKAWRRGTELASRPPI